MKLQEICVLERSPDSVGAYIGGACRLAVEIPWPKDSKGNPCMHLMTVPCNFFENREVSRFISVFIPYHDKFYYKEIGGSEDLNNTVIIIHENNSVLRSEYHDEAVRSTPRALQVVIQEEEDSPEICGSKIFNVPGWLQGEDLLPGHTCKFSMYGIDFCPAFDESRGLFSDGVVFVELIDGYELMPNGSQVGKLIWQL